MRQQTLMQFLGQKIHQIRSLLAFLGGSFEVLMAFIAMLTVSMFIMRHPVTLAAAALLVVWDILWLAVLDKGIRNMFGQRRTKWTKPINIAGAIWEFIGSLWLVVGTLLGGHASSPLTLLAVWTGGWYLDLIALAGYVALAILGLGQLILHPILVRMAARRRMAAQAHLTDQG